MREKREWIKGMLVMVGFFLIVAGCGDDTTIINPPAAPGVDMVLLGGKIVSMDDRTLNPVPGHIYQAMAIKGNKILSLGSDEEIKKLSGPDTQVINLGGRTVMPGVIDPANHPESEGIFYRDQLGVGVLLPDATYEVDFRLTDDVFLEQVISTVETAVQIEPQGEWILVEHGGPDYGMGGRRVRGMYLDSTVLKPAISRAKLTEMAPNHPVVVGQYFGVINDKAVEVLKEELSPDGVQLFEDVHWEPKLAQLMYTLPYEVWGKKAGIDKMGEILRVVLEQMPKVGITAYSVRLPSTTTKYDNRCRLSKVERYWSVAPPARLRKF